MLRLIYLCKRTPGSFVGHTASLEDVKVKQFFVPVGI
jgi:hypothetical protein